VVVPVQWDYVASTPMVERALDQISEKQLPAVSTAVNIISAKQ
jgi:hypothetical protein